MNTSEDTVDGEFFMLPIIVYNTMKQLLLHLKFDARASAASEAMPVNMIILHMAETDACR